VTEDHANVADYIRDLRLAEWGSGISLHGGNSAPLMSALGQKRTSRSEITMSALPPKADMAQDGGNVRFVPKADVSDRSKAARYSITSSAVASND
jgi:hypothetical protein